MRSLLSTSLTFRPESLAGSVRSVLRGLVDSLIALYLPPGGGALLAQLAGVLALRLYATVRSEAPRR